MTHDNGLNRDRAVEVFAKLDDAGLACSLIKLEEPRDGDGYAVEIETESIKGIDDLSGIHIVVMDAGASLVGKYGRLRISGGSHEVDPVVGAELSGLRLGLRRHDRSSDAGGFA